MSDEPILFSRSIFGGKKTSDVKARITDETKFALQRRCNELGMTESEYVDKLINISLFGLDHVVTSERERTKKVAGLWTQVGTNETNNND